MVAGAVYVAAAIGALTFDAARSDTPPHRVVSVERPGTTAAPEIALPDTPDDADDVASSPEDAVGAGAPAVEVACTTDEQATIAAAAIKARDHVLTQVEEVKEQRLAELGLLELGGELPDFVTTDLDAIDNAGQAALDEVDRKVAEAGKVCVAGGDPQAALDTL